MKTCSNIDCKQINPQSEHCFYKDKRIKSCVSKRCVVCTNEYNRNQYRKHKSKRKQKMREYNHRTRLSQFKGNRCELCGFIPIDPCQLDVDHIDGNRKNTITQNLQTLCANCHRLKTKLSYDGTYKQMKTIE